MVNQRFQARIAAGVRRRTAMHGARPHGLRHRMIQIHDVKLVFYSAFT
jgi:hypothetical protein